MSTLVLHKSMSFRAKLIVVLLVVILFSISHWGHLDKSAMLFIQSAIDSNVKSLEKVSILKTLLGIIDTTKIPFLSGSGKNMDTILGKTERYLVISGGMLMLELVVAKISSVFAVKCIPLFLSLWFLIRKKMIIPLRILVISLLITPGLSIFSNCIHLISKEASIDINTSIHKRLEIIEGEIQKEKNKLNARLRAKENKWNKRIAERKTKLGKDIARLEEKIVVGATKLESKFELGIDEIKIFLTQGEKLIRGDLIQMSVTSLIRILFLLVLLPLLFWGVLYKLVQQLSSQQNDQRRSINILLVLIVSFCLIRCNQTQSDITEVIDHKKEVKTHIPPTVVESNFSTTHLKDYHQGVDVSHFNGRINWHRVKKSGINFGYAKATQGVDFKDPYFHFNWIHMRRHDVYRGAYHFYDPKAKPELQAENFCDMVSELDRDDLVPMLDLEGNTIGGLSIRDYQKNVLTWLEIVEKKLGKKPIIYTNHPFANSYLENQEFTNYYLWIAEYDAYAPKTPETWHESGPLLWQYSPSGEVDGIRGRVDRDVMISNIKKIQ